MPWRDADIFSSFPGICLEPASCATHEDSQAHDEIGGGTWKKTMMDMSKARREICMFSLVFPKQDAALTHFLDSSVRLLMYMKTQNHVKYMLLPRWRCTLL
jgi:hypothetical protein